MQLEVDSLQMELKKKDTVIAVCNTEKDRTFERLKDEEGTYYLVYGTWFFSSRGELLPSLGIRLSFVVNFHI